MGVSTGESVKHAALTAFLLPLAAIVAISAVTIIWAVGVTLGPFMLAGEWADDFLRERASA